MNISWKNRTTLILGGVVMSAWLAHPDNVLAQGDEEFRLLAGLRDSVCFAETFDGTNAAVYGTPVDGVAGRAVANGGNVAFATSNILARATGTISWWWKNFRSPNKFILIGTGYGQ